MRTHHFAAASVTLTVLFAISPTRAEEGADERAEARITQAMDQLYLATRFDEALATLEQAIKDCADQCSARTRARLFMYVGMVHGSGRSDQQAALSAFRQAVVADPGVSLDQRFVTNETEQTFLAAGGKASLPEPNAVATTSMSCEPQGIDVQTLRKIPVSCRGGPQAHSMTLRYLPFRGDEWLTLEMTRVKKEFRAVIPCSATENAGTLSYYVLASDEAGDLLDGLGSKHQPLTMRVDPRTKSPPPSFPGEPAPARCAAEEICPPDFPGCGAAEHRTGTRDWQERCESSQQCRAGLLCRDGRCEVAPDCDIDADCASGVCRQGHCDLPPEGSREAPAPSNHRLSLLFAVDVGFVGGRDRCTAADSEYDCFERGSEIAYPPALGDQIALSGNEPGDPYPGARVHRGATVGTKRLLIDYGWLVAQNVSLGGRVGWAFGGGPSEAGSPTFLPFHGEGGVSYWPLGAEGRLQPRLDLSLGLAQVDLRGKVTVRDCSQSETRAAFQACIRGDENVDPETLPEVELDAYRKLGRGFVALGGTLVVTVLDPGFVEAGLRGMYLLPEAGFVLEPSVGAGYAF